MTSSYSTNDVSRLARISPSRVRDYARAGLVGQTETPAVPQQRRYSFDFRDVMVLRMANELLERGIASARVQRVLRAVREQLPESLPLSGLRLVALDDRILVRSQGRTWEPESGQFILSFEAAEDEQIALELPDEVPNEEDIESLLANVQEDDLSVRLRPGFRSVSQSKKMSLRRHLMPISMPSLRILSTARPI